VCRPFLYIPDIVSASSVTFSAEFDTENELLASLRGSPRLVVDERLEALSQRLESLKSLSDRLSGKTSLFSSSFAPLTKPKKMKEGKIFERKEEDPYSKFESVVGSILPKKRGRPKKEEEGEGETFIPQKRRRFAIKKVAQIKKKKGPPS
jgi:hypothetical protein